MRELQNRILKDGEVFPGDVLKVDSFLNHQIDVALAEGIAQEFYSAFKSEKVTKVLTIEASGIALAAFTAVKFGVPMVYAKKTGGNNMSADTYFSEVHSFTKNKDYVIRVDKKYLTAADSVLIVDDFLAKGAALKGLTDIIRQAGAKTVGACIAIEKAYMGGGDEIRNKGIKIYSAACIAEMGENGIKFRG